MYDGEDLDHFRLHIPFIRERLAEFPFKLLFYPNARAGRLALASATKVGGTVDDVQSGLRRLQRQWRELVCALRREAWAPTINRLYAMLNCPPATVTGGPQKPKCGCRLICPWCWVRTNVTPIYDQLADMLLFDPASPAPCDLIRVTTTFEIPASDGFRKVLNFVRRAKLMTG